MLTNLFIMKNSNKYSFNKADLMKIATGASLALGGALVTYMAEVMAQTDFGPYTAVVTALAAIAINGARKYLEGKK